MSEFFEWRKRLCRLACAASALTVLATFGANAAPCDNVLDKVCKSSTFSAYAQVGDDDDDDDDDDDEDDEDAEEFGDLDLDEEDTRDFVYDEDEGSLLVDIENCEPGKYWMADIEDGVMLPCK